jgi:hypothetical protein
MQKSKTTGPPGLLYWDSSLMVAALGLRALHTNGGLVGLDVSAFKQIALREAGVTHQQRLAMRQQTFM